MARGWGRPGRYRRDLTGATGCTGLLQRGAHGRTAAAFCGCGARAIHGASRGKPRLRPFSLLSLTSQRTRLGALTAAAAAYSRCCCLQEAGHRKAAGGTSYLNSV